MSVKNILDIWSEVGKKYVTKTRSFVTANDVLLLSLRKRINMNEGSMRLCDVNSINIFITTKFLHTLMPTDDIKTDYSHFRITYSLLTLDLFRIKFLK